MEKNKQLRQKLLRRRVRTRRYGQIVDMFRDRFNERAGQEDRNDSE